MIAAPRGEFVYVALLERAGLERKYRVEALAGLAKLRQTDQLTELLGALGELDKKGAAAEPVLRDLAPLLLAATAGALTAQQTALTRLATDSQLAVTRQLAYAALLTAEGADGTTWKQAATNPARFADLLLGIPLIRDATLRATFHPKIVPLLAATEPAEMRRAALLALSSLPGHDVETFTTLAGFVKAGTERATAIAALQRLPRASWPRDQAEALLASLIAYLQSVPADQRTSPEVTSAFQFATDLAALLPAEKAATFGKTLRALGVSVFVLRTLPEQMLFDKSLIVVAAGKPVELVLINDDAMPHNLAVLAPGALEEIGTAAEKMPPTPDAAGRLYIPDSPKVLHATKLVDPGRQARLGFTAPDTPGDYSFVCTFPGHWRA